VVFLTHMQIRKMSDNNTHFRFGNHFFPKKNTQVSYKGKGVFHFENRACETFTTVTIDPKCANAALDYLQECLANEDEDWADVGVKCHPDDPDFNQDWMDESEAEEQEAEKAKAEKPKDKLEEKQQQQPKFKVGDRVCAKDRNTTSRWYEGRVEVVHNTIPAMYTIGYGGRWNATDLPECNLLPWSDVAPKLDASWKGKTVLHDPKDDSKRLDFCTIDQVVFKNDDTRAAVGFFTANMSYHLAANIRCVSP